MFGGSVQSRLEDLEKEKDQESKKNQAYLEVSTLFFIVLPKNFTEIEKRK